MRIILNGIFPVCALIALGKALRRFELTNDDFLKTADKLIYFIFFPAMLFWKIGAPSATPVADSSLSLAAAGAVISVSLVSLLFVKVTRMEDKKVGSFCRCCYRFNTYVGMLFFALPTSTATYILSSQLRSDLDTASAGIMVSTLLAPVSLAVVMLAVFP